MNDDLRFLISAAITILELLEDKITDTNNRLLLLDTTEALRINRMKIDSAKLKNDIYKIPNKELQHLSNNLKSLQEKLKSELHETERRLEYVGYIAKLIKVLY